MVGIEFSLCFYVCFVLGVAWASTNRVGVLLIVGGLIKLGHEGARIMMVNGDGLSLRCTARKSRETTGRVDGGLPKYEGPPTYQQLKQLPHLVRHSRLRRLGARNAGVTKFLS